tara:strand:+ start:819 stop:1028 length:210 start_codon:yes stop_codon:yes gene_type:complete
MVIKRQYSIDKKNYEKSGQLSLFGRDNLYFKSINLPNPQRFQNLCKKFKLKKIECKFKLLFEVIDLNKK